MFANDCHDSPAIGVDIIETSSGYPYGMLATKTAMGHEEDIRGDSTPRCMRRTVASTCMPERWTVCIVNRDGEILLHRNMPTTPEIFLKAIAPSRQDLVVAVECMFTWYWLADLCVQEGLTCVLGHAQYMKAIHGGKAKHDRLDAQKIAVLLRGGMLPQAYAYPATMRATRDLRRRRLHLVRQRAERVTHIRQTNSQYNLSA